MDVTMAAWRILNQSEAKTRGFVSVSVTLS